MLVYPNGLLSTRLQLQQMTNNAAEYARSWLTNAKVAARFGETMRDNVLCFTIFIYLFFCVKKKKLIIGIVLAEFLE